MHMLIGIEAVSLVEEGQHWSKDERIEAEVVTPTYFNITQ